MKFLFKQKIREKASNCIIKILTIMKKLEFVATWIALFITILVKDKVNTLYNTIQIENNVNNMNEINDSNSVNVGGDVNITDSNDSRVNFGIDNSINSNVLGVLYASKDGDYVTNALRYAECYYNIGEYNATLRIYSILENDYKDNSSIITNLGFLYANGLGTSVDEEKAIMLYDRAIALGYERAASNKTALLLRIRHSDKGKCISDAVQNNNKYVKAFLLANFKMDSDSTEEEYLDFFKYSSEEEINNYIDAEMYLEELVETLRLTSSPTADEMNRYEKLGTYNWYFDDNESGTCYIYNHYRRYCKNIDILQERFIYSFEEK